MTFDNLLFERVGPVATVTINRPDVLNALNRATLGELQRAFEILGADTDVRAVILTGAGPRAFAAGADINELAALTPSDSRDLATRGQQVFSTIEELGKPVIAAINGFALGGGCELAMACTLRLAADTAKLGQPEIQLGLLPGYGGTQRLPRLVGRGRALELMLLGTPITAAEAERIGLVNRVVPADRLQDDARGLATSLAARAPLAMRAILDAVHAAANSSLADGCAFEAALFGVIAGTDDMREGTRAFLDKRTPIFQGR
jgi:enoyl-CoA hydratase